MTETPDFADLTGVDRADVYQGDLLAAHLSRTPGGVITFTYTEDWVRNGGRAIATTLPVSANPTLTSGGAIPAFFAGLLPEGRRLSALRRGVKTSADDELSLLLAVGGDTVGDVRIVPSGADLSSIPTFVAVTSFEKVHFSELLREVGIRIDRIGIAGIQDKVSAAMLSVPVTSPGAHLLLKLNPPEFAHLVENESFFINAARTASIRTVSAELVRDADGHAGLAVTRFDRVARDGQTASLAVEDGCQALGLHPAEKYRVRTETLLARLSSLCEAPIPAAATFLGQITFAYLTGNGDAHAKNFSILRDEAGRWQPAPAYDLPSSQLYGDHTLALPIDGRRDGNITGTRFVALGESIGLRERAARRVIHAIARSADDWIDGINTLPFDSGKLAKLARVVKNRQRMLLQ